MIGFDHGINYMADVAKKYLDESEKIDKKIRDSYDYFRKNVDNYHMCRKALFKSSITESDRTFVQNLNWPEIECNVLEPYVSRLRGEWSKQTPSIDVSAKSDQKADPQLNDFLEGHFRAIIDDANQDQFENEVFNDITSGGFSVMKVWTEYESNSSFNQIIKMGRVFDPTLCAFDPLARKSHKGDGEYCVEHFPMRKEEVEDLFNITLNTQNFIRTTDGFSWYYETQNVQIALVCHFYKKKYKKVKMVFLANGITMKKEDYQAKIADWSDIAEPPKVVHERDIKRTTICRYTLVGGIVREYIETDFSYLPLVFVDGNSQLLRDNEMGAVYQFTRPYVYHAINAQRMKNFMAQAFLNQIESMVQHKFMMPISALPHKPEQAEPWFNPQKAATLLFNDKDSQGREIAPPTTVMPAPIPPEIYSAFMGADEVIRNILSTFDPNLGVNNASLSGVAIVEGATQSNAVAMPYIMNYMAALTQAACIVLDLIPKYYVTPRTIPVVDGEMARGFMEINKPGGMTTKYDPSSLGVLVKASVNFEVQKQRSLETMATMAQSFPAFAGLVNQMGLSILVDNLDILGSDKLKDLAKQFEQQQMQQAQQQGQQQNPAVMQMQIKAQEAQTDSQYKQAQLQLQQQQMQADIQYKQAQLQIQQQNNDTQNQIKMLLAQQAQQQLDLNKYSTILQAQLDARDQSIQIQKAGVEQESKLADLQMTAMDMGYKHALDIHDRLTQPTTNPGE